MTWPADEPAERQPRMTVADLIADLETFDPDLPVVLDAYEYGYQTPERPALKGLCGAEGGLRGGMFGDFDDAMSDRNDNFTAVYLSRHHVAPPTP